MPSWYKKNMEACQWNNSNKKIPQNNKLFEDSECQKQCEDLNNFFSEVGKSLTTKVKPSPTTYRHFIKHINSKNSLFLAPTDAYEIQHLIKTLKCNLIVLLLQPLRWCCVDCMIHHEWDVREEQKYMYVARTSNIIEWSRRVIAIVACCHSAKLCAYAARDFRSQHSQWHSIQIFENS